MRIALTGTSGFIGSTLARRLHENGHQVTGLVRPKSRRDHITDVVDRLVEGEQSDPACWDRLLDGAEVLIHNSVDWSPLKRNDPAAHWRTNLLGSLELIRRAIPRKIIFMSTIAVHHDMRPRWKGQIDEDHPTRPGLMYGAYKAAVEAHLWAMHFSEGLSFSALRPCGVYGIDPRLDRTHGYELIQKIRRGEPITRPGGGKFVHVDDVAAAVVGCLGNDAAEARIVNLVDCYARWADWGRIACELMNAEVEIDLSSPEQPRNNFSKDVARSLGVDLNRGHDGIRAHLKQLLEIMDRRSTAAE